MSYDPETKEAKVEVRNVINIGDTIEALMPGKMNETFELHRMLDKDGLPTDRAFRPMEIITMEIPFAVNTKDLLRRIPAKLK